MAQVFNLTNRMWFSVVYLTNRFHVAVRLSVPSLFFKKSEAGIKTEMVFIFGRNINVISGREQTVVDA